MAKIKSTSKNSLSSRSHSQRGGLVVVSSCLLIFIGLLRILLSLPSALDKPFDRDKQQRLISPQSSSSSSPPLSKKEALTTVKHRILAIENTMSDYEEINNRVRFLETQVNSYLAFGYDPFMGMKERSKCHQMSELQDYCPENDNHCVDQAICLDDFPFPDKVDKNGERESCVVYDFGIRQQPEFGEILSQKPFDCKVFAFDPSPITKKWYKKNEKLKNNPNYELFDYGAGGADENIKLKEYNWNQITIYQYPTLVVNPKNCDNDDKCKYKKFELQKEYMLPVRSLPSIMKELGHEKISILKLDIEGSEYRFLETMITSGACLHVDQLTLEWHHYDFDKRYGTSSIPHINMLVALLEERCGLKQFDVFEKTGGWPNQDKIYADMDIELRYNLAAFKRDKIM